jgi:hypothetical protein
LPLFDRLTVAALAIIAMCTVTFAHEALGHGSACLALGGHITLLTSSLFRCDLRSVWIDPAGPAANLLLGLMALGLRALPPDGFAKARLALIFMTAFSFFWEGGYLMRAMILRDGDLYFFTQFLLGDVAPWMRAVGVAIGLGLYLLGARITTQGLLAMFVTGEARAVARTAWIAATLAAFAAALCYRGAPLWPDLRDAVLEIGLASIVLLIIPRGKTRMPRMAAHIGRSYPVVIAAVLVFAAFAATLGRGVGA